MKKTNRKIAPKAPEPARPKIGRSEWLINVQYSCSLSRVRCLTVLLALFVIYFMMLFKITIFRDSNPGGQGVNLVPFITITEYFRFVLRGNTIIGISNLAGNFMIFVPLGYMSALLFPKMRKVARILALSIAFSLTIEVGQYILACGSTDIDDVILNVLGGLTGYWAFVIIPKLFKPKKYAILISALMIALTFAGFFISNNYGYLVKPAPGGPRNLPALTETHNNSDEPITVDFPAYRSTAAEKISVRKNGSITDVQNNTLDTPWHLILVNKWNYIPDNYEVDLIELANGQSVDKRVYPALQEMFDDARSKGVFPIVVSGYRTAKEQQSLLDGKIAGYRAEGYSAEDAAAKAEALVAVPETSEHQIGIAVDINADGIYSTGHEVYGWLEQNAYKFGFIRRYPSDKTEITGVAGEPWHYRYVGVDAANEINNRGICLEEYLITY